MPSSHLRAAALLTCLILAGCASVPTGSTSRRPAPPRGIVMVLDGAGGSPAASNAISRAANDLDLPLYVDSFEWTHGRNRGLADMTDLDHAYAQSQKLAGQIRKYRATHPNTPISVVGYSAGAYIALESTRWLDPDCLQQIVLLAPAVSSDYDLRQALATSRNGVDSFNSDRDRFYLGLGTDVVGTADGKVGAPAAGRVGFEIPYMTAADGRLAARLHQHPWNLSVAWTGNTGNHTGPINPKFIRAYVMPLIAPVGATTSPNR